MFICFFFAAGFGFFVSFFIVRADKNPTFLLLTLSLGLTVPTLLGAASIVFTRSRFTDGSVLFRWVTVLFLLIGAGFNAGSECDCWSDCRPTPLTDREKLPTGLLLFGMFRADFVFNRCVLLPWRFVVGIFFENGFIVVVQRKIVWRATDTRV